MTRIIIVLVLLVAGLTLAACGESKEEKAQKQVCNARSDIKKQIDELQGLTVSTATVNGVKSNVKAIGDAVKQIDDAQGGLKGPRKQQVQQANQTFKSALSNIAGSIGRSTSVSDAAQQLQSAVKSLADGYQQALAPIDCS
jgi:conjugal transfer/entry exclusion protein